jgi:hypothetical protein
MPAEEARSSVWFESELIEKVKWRPVGMIGQCKTTN